MHKSLILLSALGAACHALPRSSSDDLPLVAAAWYTGSHAESLPATSVTWDKYTHVTYSVVETTPSVGSFSLSASDQAALSTLVKTAHDSYVNALVSIGGWTGSRFYSSYMASAANRAAFVKIIADLITKYEVDGIDFDWQYPTNQGIGCNAASSFDTANFLSFLKELRANPNTAHVILTATAPMTPWADSNGNPSNVTEFASLLDYITILNYDVWNSRSSTVGPNAPLKDACVPLENQRGSATSAVKAWKNAGMPANQIVLGIPGYGHSFHVKKSAALPNGGNTIAAYPSFEPKQPKGDAWDKQPGVDVCGAQTGYGGVWNFWGLVDGGWLKNDGTPNTGIDYRYDSCSETPYIYNATSEIMISFDDAKSMTAKGNFVKSEGLRGFAMREVGSDHNTVLLDAIRSGGGFV